MAQHPLSTIRHSSAHVLAQAVQCLFPDAKLGIGPAIEDGFYYDFDLPRTLTEADLEALESEMNRIIKEKQPFLRSEKSKVEAKILLGNLEQAYKVELLDSLESDTFSFYENGPFLDLCRGPHVTHTGECGVVKLLKVSGAYWRGDEKRPMLQRIYGTAFYDKQALKLYLQRLEEAKKRDHRLLGKQLELFSIQDDVGPGLVLWHPKGARVRSIIEQFWRDVHFKSGYELVYSPHMGKANLWETSGHLNFYNENMFAPMSVDHADYFSKPMNCPFHIVIFKQRLWSYRDLPFRMAELGTVYRYERSGVLHGLFRVRGFTQDDAHIFCTAAQVRAEVASILTLCIAVLKTFGFENFKFFLSTRPEKYVGEDADWEKAESALEDALKTAGLHYEIDHGGGAFYGPKIDLKIEDAIGREWQCSTIQVDFNLPERFDLNFTDTDGKAYRPFMIHRALLGSIERFFGILIEHYAGRFPTWLAPIQLRLISVNDSVLPYAKQLQARLLQEGFRVDLDASQEKLGYKIRKAQTEQVPYMAVIGDKEVESGKIALRAREKEKGDLGLMSIEECINQLSSEQVDISQVASLSL